MQAEEPSKKDKSWTALFTPEVRTNLIVLAALGAYLLSNILFYHHYEGWDPSVAFEFSIVTMSTVGYGYHSPSDDISRGYTIFAMLIGVFFVFGGISQVITARLEQLELSMKKQHRQDGGEEYKLHRRRFILILLSIVGTLFIGAFAFMGLEGWTFVKAFYFAVETSTTVGYGDLQIKHGHSRIFLGFYIVFSTVLLAFAFNSFQTLKAEVARLKEHEEIVKRTQTLDKIKELDKGEGVSQDTFVLAILEHIGVLDRETDIEPWIKKFQEIDTDHSGAIDQNEIATFSQQESDRAAKELEQLRTNRNATTGELLGLFKPEKLHLPRFSNRFARRNTAEDVSPSDDIVVDEDVRYSRSHSNPSIGSASFSMQPYRGSSKGKDTATLRQSLIDAAEPPNTLYRASTKNASTTTPPNDSNI